MDSGDRLSDPFGAAVDILSIPQLPQRLTPPFVSRFFFCPHARREVSVKPPAFTDCDKSSIIKNYSKRILWANRSICRQNRKIVIRVQCLGGLFIES